MEPAHEVNVDKIDVEQDLSVTIIHVIAMYLH